MTALLRRSSARQFIFRDRRLAEGPTLNVVHVDAESGRTVLGGSQVDVCEPILGLPS